MRGYVGKAATAWWGRRLSKFHSSLLRSPAGLAPVTGDAATDYVFPGVLTTPVARNDMVQGKLPGFLTAILAGVLVAVENLKASQLSISSERALNQIGQSDY